MKIHHQLTNFKAVNPVVTIGMFDGVHKGHLTVLAQLKEYAASFEGESVVITFWPHPRLVLSQDKGLRYLTSLEEKKKLFRRSGIDHLVILPFTREFASLGSCEFIKQYLVDQIKVSHLVIGHNHQLGKNREGNHETLSQCASMYGFKVDKLEEYDEKGQEVSSSEVRKYLKEGRIESANEILGYNYFITGEVVGGKRIGRTIGFPTANIQASDVHKLIPHEGVYAVKVYSLGRIWNGMLNIGYRPTVDGEAKSLSIEVHIFEFEADIYNQQIEVGFVRKIRDEKKFNGLDELVNQLIQDKEECLSIFETIS